MNIKYIFFDCWNTIIKYAEKDEHGDMKAIYPYINEKDKVTVEELSDMLKVVEKEFYSQKAWEISAQALLALTLEGNGLSLSIPYDEAEKLICTNFCPTPIPHTKELFEYLKKKGIGCSVLSNTTLSQDHTIEFINNTVPYHNFDFVVASSRVGAKKPSPLFFKLGAAKAKVKPEECLYIGDHFIADVYGSYGAGMHPVWFNWAKRLPNPDYPVPEFIEVEDYLELIDILEGIL